jgi:hypothetical protein
VNASVDLPMFLFVSLPCMCLGMHHVNAYLGNLLSKLHSLHEDTLCCMLYDMLCYRLPRWDLSMSLTGLRSTLKLIGPGGRVRGLHASSVDQFPGGRKYVRYPR